MPPQLEKESNGTENLAFNYFWEFLCKHFDGLQNCNKEEYKY